MAEELLRYHDLLDAGMSRERVRRQLLGARLGRASRGIYATGDVRNLDRVHAVLLRLPDSTVVGFQSAAAVYGFGESRDDAIHVIVPAGTPKPRVEGVVAHEAILPVVEHVVIDGIRYAPPARCAIDLARQVRRMDALPILDAALAAGTCIPDDLVAEVSRHRGLRGVRQARELVKIADGRAECRQESQLRLVILDGGLPAPEPQLWVVDQNGIGLYRLDLGYRGKRVGIEYDGLSHLDRDRLRHDRARLNWLDAHGWTMRFFTDRDLYRYPARIVAMVRSALS